jgi:group I intron endonuclease
VPFTAYKITCAVNGKIYIGITKRPLADRWQDHSEYALPHNHRRSRFACAIRKHGIENFSIEAIAETRTIEDLPIVEQILIAQYDSFRAGYNSTVGGDGPKGMTHSTESREKLRIANTGKKQSEETIAKRVLKLRGKKLPPRSKESRQKHSEYMLANPILWTDERRELMRVKFVGRVFTPEWKAKISAAKKGKGPSPEQGLAHSLKMRGRPKPPRTEAHRAALRASWARRRANGGPFFRVAS